MSIPRGQPLHPPTPAEDAAKTPPASPAPAETSQSEEAEKDDEQALEEMMRAALEEMPEDTRIAPGEIREVSVVDIVGESVFVDIGDKAEGVIPLSEFLDSEGKVSIQPGQVIPVEIRGYDSEAGQMQVSHKSAVARLSIARVEEAAEKKIPLVGRVTQVVKGGLIVDVGLPAFMPASQTDLHRVEDLSEFVGKRVEVLVIEFNRPRKRAVVSRRQFLEMQRKEARQNLLEGIKELDVLEGKVKNIKEFGVFVDLGGVDGFIPREEVSYDRGASPDQFFKVGDELKVQVIRLDPSSERITLSRKRLGTDPWKDAESRFPVGARIRGKVVSLTHYGAFVQVEEGITGMIHATDMSWSTKTNKKPSDYVNEGDIVEAQVLEIDSQKRRMSLGLKQITMDPWVEVESKFPAGERVKGPVTSLTNYGAFVRLDEHIEGMIHVSDMAWDKHVPHPNKVLKVGQDVECVVLKADPLQRRVSLGIKQLTESPFEQFQRAHPVGSIITGEVTRVVPFGAFVKLPGGIEGLLHVSQFEEQRVEKPEQVLKPGEQVSCKVTRIDVRAEKISLSRKEALKQLDRELVKQYLHSDVSGGTSLGEALQQVRRELRREEEEAKPAKPRKSKASEEKPAVAEVKTESPLAEVTPESAVPESAPAPSPEGTESASAGEEPESPKPPAAEEPAEPPPAVPEEAPASPAPEVAEQDPKPPPAAPEEAQASPAPEVAEQDPKPPPAAPEEAQASSAPEVAEQDPKPPPSAPEEAQAPPAPEVTEPAPESPPVQEESQAPEVPIVDQPTEAAPVKLPPLPPSLREGSDEGSVNAEEPKDQQL
jgi:small subunit ribosomal protein S1